jgi:hypothetical protein
MVCLGLQKGLMIVQRWVSKGTGYSLFVIGYWPMARGRLLLMLTIGSASGKEPEKGGRR